MSYNGWKNWETWNFKLWIENDEDTYKSIMMFAENMTRPRYDFYELSLHLKKLAYDTMGVVMNDDASFVHDFVRASISEIDFEEIAKSYVAELKSEKEISDE